MDVRLPETLNKQTLTPWTDAADLLPQQAISHGNSNGAGEFVEDRPSDETQNTVFEEGGSSSNSAPPEMSTSMDTRQWNVRDDDSNWLVMSNGRHDNLLTDEAVSVSVWGDIPPTNAQVLDIDEVLEQNPSTPALLRPCRASELSADPFEQSTDAFGAGFTDNFCEMSETDLIFRSGLVDEEFKTISVTAEEDDLWSSFTQPNELETLANQSTASGSWDPFSANQEPPNTDQVPAQSQPDPRGHLPGQIVQSSTFENQNELPKVPNILQSFTSQYSSATASSPPEVDTSIQINQHSANEIVHNESPSNENAASRQKAQSNLNIKHLLKDTTFKEIILDESWMAEKDCLESKAFTVDLNHKSANQNTQDPSTRMDLLSDQTITNTDGQPDNPNGQWTATKTVTTDLNANMATNRAPKNLLLDFVVTGGPHVDAKGVVAPPPEFDNNFDLFGGNAEGNSNMFSQNSELTNGDLLIPVGNEDEKNLDMGTYQTATDLDKLLNELGDGTVIDEEKDTSNERTQSDLDRLLNQLGDGTAIDEMEETSEEQCLDKPPNDLRDAGVVDKEMEGLRQEQALDDGDSLPNNLGDAQVVNNVELSTNGARKPSDMDRFLNELGDVTIIDSEDTPAEKERTPSDVDRFLDELGDGTVIDEANDTLAADGVSSLDNPNASEQEVVCIPEESGEPRHPAEELAQDTNEAWDQMVKEGSITVQESLPEQSSNMNGIRSLPLDTVEDIGDPISVVSKTEDEVFRSDAENTEAEFELGQTDTKLDLNAKRQSFFSRNSSTGDASFQPKIPQQSSPSTQVSSMSICLALPTVQVLPKVQTTYQRPECLYDAKPRAATDSFLSSHALLGLCGDQTESADTKSRSASEPPHSTFTIASDQPSEEAITSPRSKDLNVAAKSTHFIQALYGSKPVSKSLEQVDGDTKTLHEYEQERRNVLAAMKVKRKKKISWQGSRSQSDDLTSPDSEGPLSPTGKSSFKQEPRVRSPVSPGPISPGSASNSTPKATPEPCNPTAQTVDKPLNNAIEYAIVPEVKKQTLQAKPSKTHGKSASPGKVDLMRSPAATVLEDKKISNEVTPKKINTLHQSASPTQETLASETGPAGSQVGNDDAHIDLKKMRNLWEQKMNTTPLIERENQQQNDGFQPGRKFEMKDKDTPREETTADETKLQEEVIIDTSLEDDSTDIMPKDLDDDFDRCESFTYDVTPQRKVAIQSHHTSESIITQEIRQQKKREQQLLKEGRLKSSSDLELIEKEDSHVQFIKQESLLEQEAGLNKNHNEGNAEELSQTQKLQEARGSSITDPRNQSGRVSPRPAEAKDRKLVEPEITQKVQETQQRGRTESIVQREIRLQKEREGENALERQRALEETRGRSASGEESSRSSSGRSTPIKGRQSPILQSSSFTPIKAASASAGPKTIPIKPALTPATPKKTDNLPTTAKQPDKSPVVRFGLSSMKSEPYSNYRDYQRMLRGRKTSEKCGDKPGPMKATEGSVAVKQSPATVVFRENAAKESMQQRPPSPVVVRPPSPIWQRPTCPSPYRSPSPVEEPSSQDAPDSSQSKTETMVQREIRLAKEREAELKKKHAAVTAKPSKKELKKAFDADIPDVVIVEKTQSMERSKVSERSSFVSSPEEEVVVMRRGRETPMERDIRLAEEREMMLRKERGLPLSPSTNTPTAHSGRTKPPNTNNPRLTPKNRPNSTYNLKTANYYIEKEFEEERQRELALKVEGKIQTVSQYEDEATMDTEATLSPVKSNLVETLIEQEIRIQQEREDQYRREKGLTSLASVRLTEQGADGATHGVTDGETKDNPAKEQAAMSPPSSETPTKKYRPQRRSLDMAQQWENKFK